ncbi:MAG: Sensor protein ZraS [Candidatus Anoxychlamydiales bacterium]|nr:Sensor protein ZraS [Candidatus Anoxychlamydiales bacterium]NGX35986.1 Sensor protein ZraS [Candidatus Anoxychlamydiales bacterium]
MSDILARLNEVANDALNSKTSQESMKHLAKAFSLFSKETARLESSFERLSERFNKINYQLKKAEDELCIKVKDLNSVSTYLNSILKNISQGILFIDLTGNITTYNREAQNILNIDETKILFKRYWDNFKDDFFGFSMKSALSFSQTQNLSYICLKDENKRKEIEVSTSFVYESSHRGIIIMLRDVTKLQKLQTLAHRNDRLKKIGEMASFVAHEIKNPLGAIRGYASLLYNDLEKEKPLKDMASYIIDGTKSLERIVNSILEYTRPIIIDPITLDISSLIKSIVKSIKIDPTFSHELKINLHLSESTLNISADLELLKSAILNLIINAYEAMDEKGFLSISVIKNNYQCIIEIADTGAGIDQVDLENIFSPFFTTKRNGNGLGLSQAYKIIQAHFGTIEVRSKLYQGTTFTIILPIKRMQ